MEFVVVIFTCLDLVFGILIRHKPVHIAKKLSVAFDHVRVDFYNINGKIYFGELTHYSSSGRDKYEPSSFDFELGKYWKIEPEYWKKK